MAMAESKISERGRGILSQADREFLLGEKEGLAEQSKRDARYRIRKRLENALFDMMLLNVYLEPRDRKRVFDNATEDAAHNVVYGEPISLLIKGVFDRIEPIEHAIDHLEDTISGAVYQSILEIDDEFMVEVDVDIDADYSTPVVDELLENWKQGEETLSELQYLLRRDFVDYDLDTAVRYLEHLREEGNFENRDVSISLDPDAEPIPVRHEEDEDFENFLQEFKDAWEEVKRGRESEDSDSASSA